ncbi:hypothetical protein [Lysinibacillus sp. RC79]|uniref:hypothetical protein n=1 Tax=Lysinibacillus sp. RC79 TaxID=3156296 RepID=UPI0035112E23
MVLMKEKIYFPKLLTFHETSNNILISAVRTKLAADGLRISPSLLLLLGQGIDFFYQSKKDKEKFVGNAFAANPQLLRDLCLPLGLYLEDFRTIDIRRLQLDIKRNLLLRVAPPMLELPGYLLGREFELYPKVLTLVAGLSEDESKIILLHPTRKEYLSIDYSSLSNICQANGGIRWLMINSPSFSKPVFPSLDLGITQALQLWAFRKLNTTMGMNILRGEQAFQKCINDLHLISNISDEFIQEQYFHHLLSNMNFEFGVTWGRDLLVNALQEANSYIPVGHIIQDAEKLVEDWMIWTEIINTSKECYTTVSKLAIEKLIEISTLEKKIAEFLLTPQ